jgi:hypothetical protein
LTYWHGGAIVLIWVDFMFKKTGMTIHLGLLGLAAFIRVVIPTLFSSTSTHISLHNQLERMATCEPVEQGLKRINTAILNMYARSVHTCGALRQLQTERV